MQIRYLDREKNRRRWVGGALGTEVVDLAGLVQSITFAKWLDPKGLLEKTNPWSAIAAEWVQPFALGWATAIATGRG